MAKETLSGKVARLATELERSKDAAAAAHARLERAKGERDDAVQRADRLLTVVQRRDCEIAKLNGIIQAMREDRDIRLGLPPRMFVETPGAMTATEVLERLHRPGAVRQVTDGEGFDYRKAGV